MTPDLSYELEGEQMGEDKKWDEQKNKKNIF